jgi:MoaA/NifB/PqqE/SkfB family radical SAM enzyme
MPLGYSILYRGILSSCNYDCHYCPFAKQWDSPVELRTDRDQLLHFCTWIQEHPSHEFAVFFTPWGEALIRKWYRDEIVALSWLPHVTKVAVQTNLSCRLDWLAAANLEKIGLWCTYHPNQTDGDTFLAQCRHLDQLGASYSVGCVGLREHQDDIERLQRRLSQGVYLWINAYKSSSDYYDQALFDAFERIDRLFPTNAKSHESLGRACQCGSRVFTVDGLGNMRRCHFVKEIIGNIYSADFELALRNEPCPNATCGCHIGYVHLDHLQLYQEFGSGVLERIPASYGAKRQGHIRPIEKR